MSKQRFARLAVIDVERRPLPIRTVRSPASNPRDERATTAPEDGMMSDPLPELREMRSPFSTSGGAQEWHRGKAQRTEATGLANELMLELAALREGSRVLDVAAGTGDQTILAARRVGPTGFVLATDISASMLHIASEAARSAGLMNVKIEVMDAENLDLASDSFDAVVCRMGLMLVHDPAKALAGMRHVVKPAGRVVVLVLSTEERNPYLGIPLAVVRRLRRIPPPVPGRPGPFALSEPGMLAGVYTRAGFQDSAVQTVSLQRHFGNTGEMMSALKAFSQFFLSDLLVELSPDECDLVWNEIEEQLRQFESPSGLDIPGEALIGVGSKGQAPGGSGDSP
jgi:SAM-dependent methyltransferase